MFKASTFEVHGDGVLESADFDWLAGTYMPAPQVTRTAALARELGPRANANRVEQAIEQGADLLNRNNDPHLGAGRLNARGAVGAADR